MQIPFAGKNYNLSKLIYQHETLEYQNTTIFNKKDIKFLVLNDFTIENICSRIPLQGKRHNLVWNVYYIIQGNSNGYPPFSLTPDSIPKTMTLV